MEYEIIIGLEAHVQLNTRTKVFCGCSTKFGQKPNSSTCPVCLGLPGSLPVLNETAFQYALKTAMALNCKIQENVKFDRKNYYYPDLPKNFQISQFDMPFAFDGFVEVSQAEGKKAVRIRRVHLEEDAGKLIHDPSADMSYVDYNRSGTPLMEIVTEPDIRTAEEARDYLLGLKAILLYLEISDCNMEEGSLRCDANISIRKKGDSGLGVKVEVKNMNSFKAVRDALAYEAERQAGLFREGKEIVQETRLWSEEGGRTLPMRTKEEAHDYRYFPEPDLVPFTVDKSGLARIKENLPELPREKIERFGRQYGLSCQDSFVIAQDRKMADFFEETAKSYEKPKQIANWLMGDIMSELNKRNVTIGGLGITPEGLAELLKIIDEGLITGKTAKAVLPDMIKTKKSPRAIVASRGLTQISGEAELGAVVDGVMRESQKSVEDYNSGKEGAFQFLIGQAMRKTQGRANPQVLQKVLTEKLKEAASAAKPAAEAPSAETQAPETKPPEAGETGRAPAS